MTAKNLEVNEDIIEKTIKQVEINLKLGSKTQITLEEFLDSACKNQALQNLMCPKIS